jgi:hypothetical protein
MHAIIENHDIVERIFLPWRLRLGPSYDPYKGHVYRVLNYSCGLIAHHGTDVSGYGSGKDAQARLAIAAAFHDAGIWLDETMNYLDPSVAHAENFLKERGSTDWLPEVTTMIDQHHKLTAYRGDHEPLVETFRRADLVDLSMGTIRFGLPGRFVREVHAAFPYRGFHAIVVKGVVGWALRHPRNPVPMMKR